MPQGFSDGSNWTSLHGNLQAPSSSTEPFPTTGPHGHRKRMRARLLSRGSATIADYEVLEMLLFLGIPRIDTKPIAKATINRFGSLAAVLRASRAALAASPDLTMACVEAIGVVQKTCARVSGAEAHAAPVLSDWPSLQAYIGTAAPAELRVLYLNNRNRLLADEEAASAALDNANIRACLRRALELHGVSLLLAAWRSDPAPTRADRAFLPRLRTAGAAVSVGIHDLVLVCGGALVSVQQEL